LLFKIEAKRNLKWEIPLEKIMKTKAGEEDNGFHSFIQIREK
jgi:hypothetical protein